jgi:hypothetical protein
VRRLLHLVRAGAPDAGAVDLLHDWVVEARQGAWHLTTGRTDAIAPGPIDDDQLVQLVLAADLVAVW